MTKEREEQVICTFVIMFKPEEGNGLYPESQNDRPLKFEDKRVIFFTSRVHPGETPGSHVLNGCLDMITE